MHSHDASETRPSSACVRVTWHDLHEDACVSSWNLAAPHMTQFGAAFPSSDMVSLKCPRVQGSHSSGGASQPPMQSAPHTLRWQRVSSQ